MKKFTHLISQKGVALIIVLFSLAILSIIVSNMITSTSSLLGRSSRFIEYQQASLLCLSGEEIARQILYDDFKAGPQIDHMNEQWAREGVVYKTGAGYYEISIQDAQSKFNLNALAAESAAEEKYKIAFTSILNTHIEDKKLSAVLAGQLADWIDADSNGEYEADLYRFGNPPYLPGNQNLLDVSEVRWLRDMDARTYKLIAPLRSGDLTVLPTAAKININTVTPTVLAALTGLDESSAAALVGRIRSEKQGYPSAAEALAGVPGADLSFYGVNSSYFEVRIRAKHGSTYAYLTSRILRDAQSNGQLTVISRDFSKRFIFEFSEDYNDQASGDYEIDI